MAVAFGAAAHATEFVTNGGFESVSGSGITSTTSFEYDPSQPSTDHGVVTGWSTAANTASQSGYNILYRTVNATSVEPLSRFSEAGQYLWALPSNTNVAATAGANIGNNFMGLDGADGVRGALQQTINGLVAGQTYTLTFDWATDQLRDRDGATTEQLQVSLGNCGASCTFTTSLVNDLSHGATPWTQVTTTFTATTTGSEVLSFLSIGTPSGLPPMALLDNVSLTGGVPEPATWGLMLVGVGCIGATLRRRRALALA
jgi:hypothetical protein